MPGGLGPKEVAEKFWKILQIKPPIFQGTA